MGGRGGGRLPLQKLCLESFAVAGDVLWEQGVETGQAIIALGYIYVFGGYEAALGAVELRLCRLWDVQLS